MKTIARHAHALEDKVARRTAILKAASKLFTAGTGSLPTAAEIASAAGLAKGTVYLYFRSKEEITLDPLYTFRRFALVAYRAEYTARLERTGSILDAALRLPAGRGLQLLMRTYALTKGLWQSYQDAEHSGLPHVAQS